MSGRSSDPSLEPELSAIETESIDANSESLLAQANTGELSAITSNLKKLVKANTVSAWKPQRSRFASHLS